MIELVIAVCSILHGGSCKEVSLVFADVSLIQCQIGAGAQMEVAKWRSEHPEWSVHKYKCQEAGKFAKL